MPKKAFAKTSGQLLWAKDVQFFASPVHLRTGLAR
jgi:hypothetical protein